MMPEYFSSIIAFSTVLLVAVLTAGLSICLLYLRKKSSQLRMLRKKLRDEKETREKAENALIVLKKQVTEVTLQDSLTGLPGRQVFEDRLAVTVTQSTRYQLISSVMFLNLDRFKIINGALGLDFGDNLLKEVAKRLLDCIRQVDTVSRFAGDEFVFIFPQLTKAETAAYVAKRLLDTISRPFQLQDQTVYLTASIGIAIFPMDGSDVRTLLKNADSALHQAKAQGRNTFQFYREEMHALSKRELMLESSLRAEAVYQDFTIYYRPEIHLETRKIICMEALLRWQHPDFGLISLEEFVRLAENTGKMAEVSEWMIRTVCQHLLIWREQGLFFGPVSMPLALSRLENTNFVHHISSILQECHLDPESLVFEMTDTTLHTRIVGIEKMLRMLKHLGVRIAINSFGTGSLPLYYLRRLPIDIFRIDSLLIKDILVNRESEAIVSMIIALAKSFGANVVAEGVTSMSQKKKLVEMGCLMMQGDLFGQPLLAHELTAGMAQEIVESV